jgi:hypothetical protein
MEKSIFFCIFVTKRLLTFKPNNAYEQGGEICYYH